MNFTTKSIIFGSALCMMAAVGCTDGYESEPVEKYTLDYVFNPTDSAGKKAIQYLYYAYNDINSKCMGHNRVSNDYLDAATDDAISSYFNDCDVYRLAAGQFTVSNYPGAEIGWGTYWKAIRKANIIMANIDRVPFNFKYTRWDGERKPFNGTIKAEARFIRALCYFEMVKRYGGVPLIGDKVFDIEDDLELPRNSFADCIDFIVSELDLAGEELRGLPTDDADNFGHAPTKEACMALKARVLLYAASPLFNGNTIEPGNELVGYTDADNERWGEAAKAAKAIIDTYGPEGSNTLSLTPDFRQVFLNFYSSANPELIWFIPWGDNKNVETNNGPLGFSGNASGNGRTCPTQDLVDAFPMLDGKAPGSREKYQKDDPRRSAYSWNRSTEEQYENRDPRLAATVLRNGQRWLGVTLATYNKGGNNPTSGKSYTRTSYYMSKFMADYSSNDQREYQSVKRVWVMLRYAEVLLNYAEAQNEYAGADQSVYNAIIALRQRAGIEPGDDNLYGLQPGMSKEEMRAIIHNERRCEMAFEEQRFWDIRRWREAEKIFADPVHGMTINLSNGKLIFNRTDLFNANWDNRRYLYPIPYSEVLKNSNMVQNPNW